tara:strand:+ start:3583 stop:4698 length:1116 start_codon:yes stop_codon:yes gene_type:complete
MPNKKISLANPIFTKQEEEAVQSVIKSGWVTMGERVKKFEQNFARHAKSQFAIAMFNGTVTLHAALIALGVKPDDEVIVPTLTYISSANVVLYSGAKLVLCECNPQTYNIELEDIKKVITKKTKVILTVDMNGMPINYDQIIDFAKEKGISILGDSAESLGAIYKDSPIGSQVDLHSFSFFGNKNITTGEGGMLTTNNESLANELKILRNQGQESRYNHTRLGFNYRMTELQAAIGIVQLESLESRMLAKEKIVNTYNDYFSLCENIRIPFVPNYVTRHSWYMYTIEVDEKINRDQIVYELDKAGIETRLSFPPVHIQPYYIKKFGYKKNDYPTSLKAWEKLINLPISPNLSKVDQEYVMEKTSSIVKRNS